MASEDALTSWAGRSSSLVPRRSGVDQWDADDARHGHGGPRARAPRRLGRRRGVILEAWNGLKAAVSVNSPHRNRADAMIMTHNVSSWLEGSERAANPEPTFRTTYSFRYMPQCTVPHRMSSKGSGPSSKRR